MATIILTTLIGRILSASAFIGGSYLAKAISGKNQYFEVKRHDEAVAKYQRDYNKWKEEEENKQQWREEEEEKEGDASLKIRNTNQN